MPARQKITRLLDASGAPIARSTPVAVKLPPESKGALAPTSASMFQIIAEAASKGHDVRTLVEIHRELEAREAARQFTEAKVAMRPSLPVIDKNGKLVMKGMSKRGKEYELKARFVKYDELAEAVFPILQSHGFDYFTKTRISPDGATILVATLQRGGHSEIAEFICLSDEVGAKSPAQALASATTFFKRHGLIHLAGIISKDPRDGNDTDAARGPIEGEAVVLISDEDLARVHDALKDAGVTEGSACAKYKIDRLEDLKASDVASVLSSAKSYKERMSRG